MPSLARSPSLAVTAIVASLLASCGKPDEGSAPSPSTEPCTTTLTWTNFAEPLMTTWCAPCHSAGVPEEDRQGAPLDVNFDTVDQVLLYADRIIALTSAGSPTMPPGGGPTDEERAMLEEWLTCGAATTTTEAPPTDPCTPRIEIVGDARTSTWSCPGNVVVGDLVIDGPAECVCEVTGTVRAEASVVLPDLVRIGGDLEVVAAAEVVDAPWLAEVGGAVRIEANEALTTIDLWRLETIGGELALIDNPALETLPSMTSLVSVGDLVIRGNTMLASVEGLPRVEALGSLELAENPALTAFLSLLFVTGVDGEIVIRDNDALTRLDALPDLTRAGSIRILGNDKLGAIATFAFLTELDGTLEVDGNAVLRELGNGADGGGPFEALGAIGGDLRLTDNPELMSIAALNGVETVGGGVEVTNNPRLSTAAVESLVSGIDSVGGEVVIDGNGSP